MEPKEETARHVIDTSEANQEQPLGQQEQAEQLPVQTAREPIPPQITSKWLVPVLIFALVFSLGLAGFFAYKYFFSTKQAGDPYPQNPTSTQTSHTTPTPSSPNNTNQSAKSNTIESFEMDKYEVILQMCGENWEGTENKLHEKECLKFYGWGKVEKTIDGMTVTNNDNLTDEEKDTISSDVISIYEELHQEKYKNWLLKGQAPEVGSIIKTITTYDKSKVVKDVSSQYLVTDYRWGVDNSKESQRLKEIFEHLKSYTPDNAI